MAAKCGDWQLAALQPTLQSNKKSEKIKLKNTT